MTMILDHLDSNEWLVLKPEIENFAYSKCYLGTFRDPDGDLKGVIVCLSNQGNWVKAKVSGSQAKYLFKESRKASIKKTEEIIEDED